MSTQYIRRDTCDFCGTVVDREMSVGTFRRDTYINGQDDHQPEGWDSAFGAIDGDFCPSCLSQMKHAVRAVAS